MSDRRSSPPDGLTHTPEELIARYHKAMGGRPVAVLEIDVYSVQRIVARATFEDGHTRPGGMVAGPILFTLADTIAYFVTISRSPKGSEAFTTAISMEFLSPAPVGVLLVEGRVLRFGRRSCVVDTAIHCSGRDEPVAHAVVTYAPVFPGQGSGVSSRYRRSYSMPAASTSQVFGVEAQGTATESRTT